MTFELGTLLIEYRRKTTQKVTGIFCKICMKLRKMMILGFPPEQKRQIRQCRPEVNAFPTQNWDTQGTPNLKDCLYALDVQTKHACDISFNMH